MQLLSEVEVCLWDSDKAKLCQAMSTLEGGEVSRVG